MTDIIGFTGAGLLAICAIPQAILSVIQGHSYGLSHGFLWSWLLGEICMLYFTVVKIGVGGPLYWNYVINTILLIVIAYYRYFPRVPRV